MSRIYDNWERLVAAALKREQFREMALAPSTETSFTSRQSDLTSFTSTNHHVELAVGNRTPGATPSPRGIAARVAILFSAPLAYFRRRIQQDHSFAVGGILFPEIYLGQLERFSLLELQVATDNFSNENILGRGEFGHVYKGQLTDGTLVAIKRLTNNLTQGRDLQFQMEVETISLAVHRNLLKLCGFCMTLTEKLLVYPYMANGSVASCIRERPESQPPLDWPIRYRIALGSARGVAYLHDRSLPIIHCDIKAANILLDEDFEAVVGDFGLAKVFGRETHVTTAVCGTIGLIAPECLSTGILSEKIDVYAYGVMLLELITGKTASDLARLANNEDVTLLDWVKGLMRQKKLEMLVDADLKGNYIDEEVGQLIRVALRCTQDSPNKRPNMFDVVKMLQTNRLVNYWWMEEIWFNHKQYPEAADDDPPPGIEGLQISGDAFPGSQIQACGYSINGTTSCNFEWVRHLEDGSFNYIDGAKQPNYLITADDIDTYLAVEVQPLDDKKRKGELVKVFANEHRKITCVPEMQTGIEKTLYRGHASYNLSLSTTGFLDIWEPATLAIKRDGYTVKCSGPSGVLVTDKFSSSTIITIPYGSPTEFSIVDSQGNERILKADNSSTDIINSRDTIVLTLRLFIIKAGEKWKGKKKGLFFYN